LPQAVANSFLQWTNEWGCDLVVTHPEGYQLADQFTQGITVLHDQDEALKGADFVYAKNWSSFQNYGQVLSQDSAWMVTKEKMSLTNDAHFMHCLPVRRNVVVSDEVIDQSLVIPQANNRTFAAQAVIAQILENG
jgi:N-succinyl-L-ornithine transcarbamylase